MRCSSAYPRAARPLAALLLLAACLARPAAADWLITRAGERIETQGAWRERGKLVVFTQADGTLVSLRLDDLDLEASRAATTEAARRVALPAGEPARSAARLRLTDKDFRRPEGPDQSPSGSATEGSGERRSALSVATWERQRSPADGHVVISGTMQNGSDRQATLAGLTVRLFEAGGGVVATAEAQLTATTIPPGGSARFEVDFPDVFGFASVKFDTKSFDLGLKPGSPAAIPTKPGLAFTSDRPDSRP